MTRIHRTAVPIAVFVAAVLSPGMGEETPVWQRGPDLPLARAGTAAAWLRDRLVVAGGSYWEEGVKKWTGRVDAFNPTTGTWEALPPLPTPVANGGTASDGESLFTAGGLTATGVTNQVWRLRRGPGGWRWAALAPLPKPTLYGAAACVGGRLYHVGGAANPDDLTTATSEALRLDVDRDGARWEPVAAVPGRARAVAAAAAGSRSFYLFGGCYALGGQRVENLAEVLEYLPAENRWRQRAPMARAVRAAAAAALPGGRLVIAGGFSGGPDDGERFGPTHGFERQVLVYDPRRNRYQQAPPLPLGVSDGRCAASDGRLYFVAGEDRRRSRVPLLVSIPLGRLISP